MFTPTSFTTSDSPVATTAGVSFLVKKLAILTLNEDTDTNYLTIKNLAGLDNTVNLAMGSPIGGDVIKLSITLLPNEIAQIPLPTGNNKVLTIGCYHDIILAKLEHLGNFAEDEMLHPFHPTFSLGSNRSYSHSGYLVHMKDKSYIQLQPSKDCEVAKIGIVSNKTVTILLGRYRYTSQGYCNLLLPTAYIGTVSITAEQNNLVRLTITGQRQATVESSMQQWSI